MRVRRKLRLSHVDGQPPVVRIEGPLPPVLGDRRRVRQVLDNLLSNARKFSLGRGCIEIELATREQEVVVSVRDYGMGIPAEAIPKLFTRFFRVDNSETRKIGGTGLGLHLANGSSRLRMGESG